MPLAWIVFSLSLLYTAYIIVVYPIIISVLARYYPKKVRRGPQTRTVSLVIAAHNGAAFLAEKLNSVFALEYPQEQIQTIVVNDGSTDETQQIGESFGNRIELVNSAKLGKAGALNEGMRRATGEILVLTDVRQRLAPDSLRYLIENFADPSVGAVSAELQIDPGSSKEESDTGLYWKYERWLRLNLSSLDSIFGASGSYYAVRRELAVLIPRNTLVDDMYLPLHAFFRGYRLIVDPRAQMYDFPTSLSVEFGRKVRTLAGNYQILQFYPQLLGPKNRLLLHFVSYKLGRLLLPFVLISGAVASLFLGRDAAMASCVFQVIIYSAAVLDHRISPKSWLKRLTSPIRTFLMMMLATLCAISIWFVPPERLWKPTHVSRRDVPIPVESPTWKTR